MSNVLKYPKIASTALTLETYNKVLADAQHLGLSASAWLRRIVIIHYQEPVVTCQPYDIIATKKEVLDLINLGYEIKWSPKDV